MILHSIEPIRAAGNLTAGWESHQQGRQIGAKCGRRGVVERSTSKAGAAECVQTRRVHGRQSVVDIGAEVIATAKTMLTAIQGPGRLKRVRLRVLAPRESRSDIGVLIEVDVGKVMLAPK